MVILKRMRYIVKNILSPFGCLTTVPGLCGITKEDIDCRCTEGIKVSGVNTQYRKDNMSKKLINLIIYDGDR